uniref:Uncharacterized protein n=1 Tax=Arundo donax TaxID=35708 RepID=A0A0A9FVP6_ARUDO
MVTKNFYSKLVSSSFRSMIII